MTVELIIHLEAAEDEAVWWAESPDVAGFTAAGSSLSELRRRAHAALTEITGGTVQLVERMAQGDDAPDGLAAKATLIPD
jgi:predicted RNase H-like HicB family nuclease